MRYWLVFLLCWCWLPAHAEQIAVPALRSPVTDLTNTLSADERAQLEALLRQHEQQHGSQVAVLVVPTTGAETIEQYSLRVVEQWQLGREREDDGVLLLVAQQDRAIRIEVGYGLEGALTDAQANRIIREVIAPAFRAGRFYDGIHAALLRIFAALDGQSQPLAERPSAASQSLPWPLLLFGGIALGSVLRSVIGRLPAALVSAAIVDVALWVLLGSFWLALLLALVAFVFVLAQHGGGRWNNRRGGWGGMSGGSGNWGGGGFGGWSGGGGGFGGGGASGRW